MKSMAFISALKCELCTPTGLAFEKAAPYGCMAIIPLLPFLLPFQLIHQERYRSMNILDICGLKFLRSVLSAYEGDGQP